MDFSFPAGCLLCLNQDCVNLHFDRNGKPYLRCSVCGSNLFLKNDLCLSGAIFFTSLVSELSDEELVRIKKFIQVKLGGLNLQSVIQAQTQRKVEVKRV